MKLDLLTNATVVDDAIRFVHQQKSSMSFNNDRNGSKKNVDRDKSREPDYGEKEEDQLEKKTAREAKRISNRDSKPNILISRDILTTNMHRRIS
jgi:protein required for attachment to host cells